MKIEHIILIGFIALVSLILFGLWFHELETEKLNICKQNNYDLIGYDRNLESYYCIRINNISGELENNYNIIKFN